MNTKRVVAVTAGLLLIAGCASTKSPDTNDQGMSSIDAHYVGAVDRAARARGTRVIWFKPPSPKGSDDAGE